MCPPGQTQAPLAVIFQVRHLPKSIYLQEFRLWKLSLPERTSYGNHFLFFINKVRLNSSISFHFQELMKWGENT